MQFFKDPIDLLLTILDLLVLHQVQFLQLEQRLEHDSHLLLNYLG